jgi:uncharacterized protein (TIGR03000 family)
MSSANSTTLVSTAGYAGPPATAKVTVHLPSDAKLFVDDVVCPLTSDWRSFDTPQLQPGQRYFYTIRAEAVRAGKTITQSQRVIVEAGKDVSVNFSGLGMVTSPQP